jgi:DNA-binding Xre family transcriptional regulator
MISIKELERFIADKDLTVREISNLIGVKEEKMLSLFKSEDSSINTIEEIARRLDIPIGRLFGEVNQTSGGDSYNAQGEATVNGGSNNSASLINVQSSEELKKEILEITKGEIDKLRKEIPEKPLYIFPDYIKLLLYIIGAGIIFWLLALIFHYCGFEIVKPDALVMTFVGIIATFVVISNYMQVKEVKDDFLKYKSNIETELSKRDSEIENIKFEFKKPLYDSDDMREPFNGKKIRMMVELLIYMNLNDDEIMGFVKSCIHAPTTFLRQIIHEYRNQINNKNLQP